MMNSEKKSGTDNRRIWKIYGTDYKEMTKKILAAADLAGRIGDRGRRVGIKPNLVVASPAQFGGTTHPEVVAGIMLHESIASCLWNKMFKAELLAEMTFDETISIGEDLLFLVEYISKCDAFYLVAAPLYNYLINPGGAMKTIMEQTIFERKWLSEWESISRAQDYVPASSRIIRDVFEYKKMLIANKILTKAAKCGFEGPECGEMKDYIKKNRIRAVRNPYLKARVKAKAFSY